MLRLCTMDSGTPRYTLLSPVLVLIGFTSVIAQIVLMRELIVVCHGNEISLGVILASWLFWTALGSGVLGKVAARTISPRKTVAVLQLTVAVVIPLSILAVRASRVVLQTTPGEILGPGPMFLVSFVVLSAFCLTAGCLFAAGSRLHTAERGSSSTTATGSVYLLEAAGSGLGGILASLVLIRYFSAFEIGLLLSGLNIIAAATLMLDTSSRRRTVVGGLVAVLAFSLWPVAGRHLESLSLRQLWRGFTLVDVQNSPFGNLAVVATEDTRTLFQNGAVLLTIPDPAAAEEAVHYALLQHPSPKSLLLIGGGLNGSLYQALKHPSLLHVDFVELDPTILELGRRHFPDEWLPVEKDTRVKVHYVDGRFFLKRGGRVYDTIIVNLPDPQTAQLNRFYTLEFFQDVAEKLAPGGVFSFQVTGAENYISEELAQFLRCVNKTLLHVFPRVIAIPGATIHFFAGAEDETATEDANVLLELLHKRGIETSYVREYYIPFRMTPDRMDDLDINARPEASTPVNKDFAPIAYYFNTALWSTRFQAAYRHAFHWLADVAFARLIAGLAVILSLLVIFLVWRFRGVRRLRAGAGFCVASMGFTMIGLEVLLLLGFQAIYGYVYHQLAIIIAAFMGGMALGSHRSLRDFSKTPRRAAGSGEAKRLIILQILAAASPMLMLVVFLVVREIASPAGVFAMSNFLFPALALVSGVLGGYQFPIASRVYFNETRTSGGGLGTVYALDLVGACLGAAVLSAYLIPIFGFARTAVIMVVINLAPAVLVATSLPRSQRA
ncbi:MAG: fused MFS/spermidine synthase [Candidatus Latescibacterota bacterium]|nr:MAG: fused MFS/spermidine synthase [Candidatus Latescibacterota bacterium]